MEPVRIDRIKELVAEPDGAASRPRLIEFYEVNSQPLVDGRLANGVRDDVPEERKQVVEWFRSPETQKLIEEQYGLA